MKDKVRIRFTENPPSTRYSKDTHALVDIDLAYEFVKIGVAVGYDGSEDQQVFLGDEFPHTDLLAENGIYTKEQLENRLYNITKIDGIGKVTAEKYAELLQPEIETDEDFFDDLEDALNQ